MILKEIRLKNIRSYKEERISFPEGASLLSGDIGSGKTSILYAVEFALFGIMKGMLSGENLLRSGSREGEVELSFSIGKDSYLVKRALKRTSKGVQQDSGYLVINGEKKEKSPIEIKSAILEALGYPKGLLQKSKDLVFRYTVYTPQEEMKQIISESSESRLNILRSLFGIEKYRIIWNNCQAVGRILREKIRAASENVRELGKKKEEMQECRKAIETARKKEKAVIPKMGKARNDVREIQKSIKELEADTERLNRLGKEYASVESELKAVLQRRASKLQEAERLRKEIGEWAGGLAEKKPADILSLEKRLAEAKKLAERLSNDILAHERKLSELKSGVGFSEGIKQKLANMDKCPTCEQVVDEAHKSAITERENRKIDGLAGAITSEKNAIEEKSRKAKEAAKESDSLASELSEARLANERMKAHNERKERLLAAEKELEAIKREIGRINTAKIGLTGEIKKLREKTAGFEKQKARLEEAVELMHSLDKEAGILEKEIEGQERVRKMLEKSIKDMEAQLKRLETMKIVNSWVSGVFPEIVTRMEASVMRALHGEFNSMFRHWFDMLMEDDLLNIRLDEKFAPVIEQNGYEVGIESLSGGEKTSCALAYRLALNRVINDMIDTIKTKDIIILDEPTDGFSTEQLDRMRDLLEMIGIRQVIIVSHESKIESFVDNIIRIVKDSHISRVAA